MNVLIVDVGGTSVKLWHSEHEEKRKFRSGDDLAPEDMIRGALSEAKEWRFDVIALGLPCRVVQGRPVEEPANLANGWLTFDYAAAFGKPVRILNDADLQALGSYRGGRLLFVGLGTGVGSTLITRNTLISLDLGLVVHGGETVVDLLGRAGRKRLGNARWRKTVLEIVPYLAELVHADDVVIGGGQADKLDRLPEGARLGENGNVVAGGVRLWQELPDPAEPDPGWRIA
jgi:polyphosphate glucokinase